MNVHPDFEALSAAVDGEDEEAGAHVRGCAECAARVASLTAVREAVARPVAPLAADRQEQALAAALGAFDGGRAEEVAAGSVAPVVSLASRRWQWVTGSAVAAALVLVVGMVTLFGQDARRESGDTAASAPVAESDKSAGAAGGQATGDNSTTFAGGADGGDLGELASVEALRTRYASRATALLSPSGAGTAEARTNSGATGSAPAPGVPPPVQVGTRACEIEARAARPAVGVVVYAATARFQGTAAVVLGFGPTAGSPPTVLVVLAPEQGCRLLAETTPS
ncbi:MAG: hypothetical protein ACRD2W_08070 [Acidimicrobiales bacterium]